MSERISLIGWSPVAAVRADELVVGDVTIWNYGYREIVVAIEPKGAQSLAVTIKSAKTGALFTRTMRRSRLVGVAR